MKKWIFFTSVLGFSAYWASNLLLWFPWSYSPSLGITLMLTLTPVLWAYVTYLALVTYPKMKIMRGAVLIGLIFLILAAGMDYVFFGLIRNAMEDLYHPTTFYGYGFLVFWPFILALMFKHRIAAEKKETSNKVIFNAGISGLICFGILTLIILFGIEI
ncbi:hypothetical protein [Lutimonas sp.]|uniref:hypothetical protein n=1 Tax=Lutimonas sp. TaxID=1872403 RepID=UPI003D9B341D